MRNLFRILFLQPTENILLQLFRYGFVGGAAFAVDYSTMILLTEIAGLNYLLSSALSFILGLITNYLLSISWVFSSSRKIKPGLEFLVFAIIGIVGLGLNELIMYMATECLSIHYMVSKLISTALVFLWNFLARKFTLFRD